MKYIISIGVFVLFAIAITILLNSKKQDSNSSAVAYSDTSIVESYKYTFAVHPLYNPDKLYEVFQPLVDHLNEQIPNLKLKLIASKDYAAFEDKLYKGQFDIALPNPYQTLLSLNYDYSVFGKMGNDERFTGILLVRKDSKIKTIQDVKGKKISYPSATALAACMMPQNFLYQNGIDINKDVTNVYVGSQVSSILNVYSKNVDIGATWPIPWFHFKKNYPEKASELKVIWETKPLINNGLVYNNNVPAEIVEKLGSILFDLHTTTKGLAILDKIEITKFEPATDSSFFVIKDFLDSFSKNVRPI